MRLFSKITLAFTSLWFSFLMILPDEFSKLRVRYYNKRGGKIHKSVAISPNVRIRGRVEIDEGTSIAQNSSISGEKVGVFIGKNVMIAPNVVIVAFNHGFEAIERPMAFQTNTEKKIVIEDDVWIASNCSISKGVTIGKGSIIGANSFVNKDVPPFSIVGGVPAKVIKSRI
ncbi:acyltransferase [Chryseobacterium formosus]|uniref:Acyltransferase n=1 Tax=Chryseobacterium formosus TaxID=1537363 RepID=A0ABT3XRI4_9FLAO|nr:acyltransferase [Chryseobacterium formosus]MCX8523530.1 acyltransferase [Chryseobacterium formosus]